MITRAIEQGRLGFLTWWFATAAGRKQMGDTTRLRDQLTFVAEIQRDYYAEMKRWLQEDLGCRQLVMTSNFRAAEPPIMQDLENWVKAAGDVITLNSYPGVVEPQVSDAAFNTPDIAPTLLALMGLPQPEEMTGSNLIQS